MGDIRVFRANEFQDLVQTLNQSFQTDIGCVLLLEAPLAEKQANVIRAHRGIVCLATGTDAWKSTDHPQGWPDYIRGFVADPSDRNQILWALEEAKRTIELRHENEQLRLKMQIETEKLKDILNVSLELSGERDWSQLCDHILSTMRKSVHSEGASLYLADHAKHELKFSHIQNEKFDIKAKTFRLPIDENSMAGACAKRKEIILIADVNNIPAKETFKFNSDFDKKTGYETKSIACIPLLKTTGELVGVIQLINSKRASTFTSEDLEIASALAAPVAISLETALLYQNIEELFEGFIRASVSAIESRDPTTSGHSERVADLTVKLAQEVSESGQKAFQKIKFSAVQFKELRYASLLHDFGKIGVPEHILLKEKKLYPIEFLEIFRRLSVLKMAYPKEREKFENLWKTIVQANEPSVSFQKTKNDLKKFVGKTFEVMDEKIPLLTKDEWDALSINKGSLSEEDRLQIEAHVTHTYEFLSHIPWTSSLSRVPEIAYAHHEKLDGSGYPRGLHSKEIPFESQIMAITDVFDALTASDRPYKKSLPNEKALEIILEGASKGQYNRDLVELFSERKVYQVLNSNKKHSH
ncbi:MAG: GAF domain-containing protein [Deltaproteobacteria bacterium]|nr:GAF domain-containing protein [Deltaproteobacteria bacterium]